MQPPSLHIQHRLQFVAPVRGFLDLGVRVGVGVEKPPTARFRTFQSTPGIRLKDIAVVSDKLVMT